MMNTKEIVKLYIDVTQEVNNKERRLEEAFYELNSDNQFFSLIPYEYSVLVEKLICQIIPPDKFEWLNWYLYETTRGVSDNTGCMDLETFDEFYAFAFEHVTVTELMEKRNENLS